MFFCFFFVRQNTAYELRISDWSSDVCSSDLLLGCARLNQDAVRVVVLHSDHLHPTHAVAHTAHRFPGTGGVKRPVLEHACHFFLVCCMSSGFSDVELVQQRTLIAENKSNSRSEEHTSELQSLMRISYAVFCLKKKKSTRHTNILLQQI